MDETPITKSEAIGSAFGTSLHLIFYYAIALSIWGFALKKSIFSFCIFGVVVATVISLLFVGPVISKQKTKQKTKEMMFATVAIWGNIGIVIGVIGLLALVVRIILF